MTRHDRARIQEIREQSGLLVTIGACATAGGIQSLRNFADVKEWIPIVYASPEYISTLEISTPIADHSRQGRPRTAGLPDLEEALVETMLALLNGRRPKLASTSVCFECKARGTVCVTVAHGTPCLGPVTHAGCGTMSGLQPGLLRVLRADGEPQRGGAREPVASVGMKEEGIVRALRTFNAERPSSGRRAVSSSADGTTTSGDRTDYLARVEGEGAMFVRIRGDEVEEVQFKISSRPASSRRSSAGGSSPRRRISRRESAASARSPPSRAPQERLEQAGRSKI